MRLLLWALRVVLFFLLFAFALNNQHEAVLKGFFGAEWRTPMVVVVLVSFAAGALLALLAVAPRLWRRGSVAHRVEPAAPAAGGSRPPPGPPRPSTGLPGESGLVPLDHPPRDGV